MSLVIEDGTGLANANSFATVQEADDYMSTRGITTWTGLQTPEKEQALVRAADFMRGYDFQGVRAVSTQALTWPRNYVYLDGLLLDKTVIPADIKNAQIELAWRGAGGPLNPDLKGDDSGRLMTKKVEKVGPIDEETTYATRGPMATPMSPVWSAVNVILAVYLRPSYGVYR